MSAKLVGYARKGCREVYDMYILRHTQDDDDGHMLFLLDPLGSIPAGS